MQRKQGLVPVAEALADLRPTQRPFTQADQVHQLVGASEADADLGFMARLMALARQWAIPPPGPVLSGEHGRAGVGRGRPAS